MNPAARPPMLVRPRLRSNYAVEILDDHAVFLLGEHRQVVVEGAVFAALVPLLDGTHAFGDLVGRLGLRFSVPEIASALVRLQRRGCLAEADGEEAGVPAHLGFWDALGADTAETGRRLSSQALAVRTMGDIDATAATDALAAAGLRTDDGADFTLVLTDDYLHPELLSFNRDALAGGRSWLLAKPAGTVLWVGPVFQPGQGGCWQCLSQRLHANRQVERYIRSRNGEDTLFRTSRARLPSQTRAGLNLAATEAARAITQPPQATLSGKVVTLDLFSLEMQTHLLVQRPQCPACGTLQSGLPAPAPLTLQSRPKHPAGSAGGRSSTPEQTFERLRHHVSPVTGVVTALNTREEEGFGLTHNYVAGHYFPMLTDDMTVLRVNGIARSGGKGMSDAEAKTGALCESLERYAGICWGDEPTVHASHAELGEEAVHARDLLLYSEAQYRERENTRKPPFNERDFVPDPLPDDTPIAWSPAYALGSDQRRYLPTAYCFYGHRDPGVFFCRCDSNGCAAGNSLEEAILQGLLELIERDAVALWWYNRLRRPAVDVDSFGLDQWQPMHEHYRQALGRDLHVLDVTSDLGVPCFAVVSRRLDRAVEDIIVGFGVHVDPRAALLRALAEANQYLPALRKSAADGSTIYRLNQPDAIEWWRTATHANQPYLVPDPRLAPRVPGDFAGTTSNDILDDLNTCADAVAAAGLEVLVVNQTRADLDLPVARVVVPGLRHFWRRLAPGRLYDVPVRLGWLEHAHTETELNPIACFV